MNTPSRCPATSLLALAVCLFAPTADVTSVSASEPALRFYVPPVVDSLQIGDPIFLPVSIVNRSTSPVRAPTLMHHGADLRLEIACGDTAIAIQQNQGYSAGDAIQYDARTAEVTVLLVNCWTPAMTAAIIKNRQCTVSFTSRLLPKTSCTLNFDSSSLNEKAYVRLKESAEADGKQEYAGVAPVSALGGRLVAKSNTTPLTWLVKRSDPFGPTRREAIDEAWIAEAANFVDKHVKEDTKLLRFFEFDGLMLEASQQVDRDGWAELLPKLQSFLSKCSTDESFYYVTEIFAARRKVQEQDRDAVEELLRRTFPLYAHMVSPRHVGKAQRVLLDKTTE